MQAVKLQGREEMRGQPAEKGCICEAPFRCAKDQSTWKLLELRLPPLPLISPPRAVCHSRMRHMADGP